MAAFIFCGVTIADEIESKDTDLAGYWSLRFVPERAVPVNSIYIDDSGLVYLDIDPNNSYGVVYKRRVSINYFKPLIYLDMFGIANRAGSRIFGFYFYGAPGAGVIGIWIATKEE
jgi:hypothetical protein